jgi:hypothetical protein
MRKEARVAIEIQAKTSFIRVVEAEEEQEEHQGHRPQATVMMKNSRRSVENFRIVGQAHPKIHTQGELHPLAEEDVEHKRTTWEVKRRGSGHKAMQWNQ